MSSLPTRRMALGVIAVAALGCTIHVETPRITPQNLEFTGFDNQGLSFRVQLSVYNANSFELNLRDLNSHLYLQGNDVGSSVATISATLPPYRETPVTAQVTVPWSGAPAYLLTGVANPSVEYRLIGQVTVQHYLSVRADFDTSGQVPREFFLRGAQNSINSVINSVLPGFGGVQMH